MGFFKSRGSQEPQQKSNELADEQPSGNSVSAEKISFEENLIDTPLPLCTVSSLLLCLIISMGGFIFGYDTGQIAGYLRMKNFLNYFGEGPWDNKQFSNVRSGLIVGILSIGTCCGALTAAPIADRVGRKPSITFWCMILWVGLIIQISSPAGKWYQFMLGRLVTGLGIGSLSLLVPLFQGETAPRHIRGAMVSCYQLFVTLGIFISNCINYNTQSRNDSGAWRIPLGITFAWGLILGTGILCFPETPRFDYKKGNAERAKQTMMRFYGVPENHRILQIELREIHEKNEEDKEVANEPFFAMFTAPGMFKRLVLGMALQMWQQLTGANYYFYYGTTVFAGAGISNSYVTQMILGGVNFGTTFLGLYFVDHLGRRKSLILGAIWMFCCFIVFATIGHFVLDYRNPENTPVPGKVMVVFACLFILGFASTWGPMVWTLISEIYPSRYRARAMALPTASNWLWNFLLSFFTPFITSAIDFRYGYVFAGCLAMAGLTVYFFVIETAGRTIEEVDTMYKLKVKPWKSAEFVIPDSAMQTRHGNAGTDSAAQPASESKVGAAEHV
ncbi:hexose transporter hxt1 [Ascosphaera aggregata]|nr:hexose transporter hxt1 [Ascosphaera aggregata]